MEARGCALMLLTPDRQTLFHAASFGLSDWFVRKGPVIIDKSMSDTLEGKSLAILDAVNDERVMYRKQLQQEGLASVLSIPVKLKDTVMGVMRVYTSTQRCFTDDDIKFAVMAADFGAIALEAADSFNAIQEHFDTFKQDMLQWRAELGYEWTGEPAVMPFKEIEIAIPPGG
jgi:signal transduction protein with GAF and PtsI domain